MHLAIDLAVIVLLLAGVAQFRTPHGGRRGNLTAAIAIGCAAVVVLARNGLTSIPLVILAGLAGSAVGWLIAARVHMIQIPAMVAFQHGMGGLAAMFISLVEVARSAVHPAGPTAEAASVLGLGIGAATFSASLITAGKLSGRLRPAPTRLAGHSAILTGLAGLGVGLMVAATVSGHWLTAIVLGCLVLLIAVVAGVVLAIRVGGADMPVLISFLNATAGLAASFCGLSLGNRLLIACGATVAASGSILTIAMCRAMNRRLVTVFAGLQPPPAAAPPATAAIATPPAAAPVAAIAAEPLSQPVPGPQPQVAAPATVAADPFADAVASLKSAKRVVIIPGYGMALADAGTEVVTLGEKLTAAGKEVLFAIHPVAGRMPGHMHVLLAEAEVDYGLLRELKDVNDQFASTDVALIVGACDVVNPAALDVPGTPISGMPILNAHQAARVIVCNLDERPGYSGVENPLYRDPRTLMLLGDAKATVGRLVAGLGQA